MKIDLIHKMFDLTSEDIADILIDIAENINIPNPEKAIIEKIQKYDEKKRIYASYLTGRFFGMYIALLYPEGSSSYVLRISDVSEMISKKGKEKVKEMLIKEISEDLKSLEYYLQEKEKDVI